MNNGVTSLLIASHDEDADMPLQNSHAEGWWSKGPSKNEHWDASRLVPPATQRMISWLINFIIYLRVQIISYLPHLGQIANNVHTQINDKINESADHSLVGGWDGPNGAGKNSVIFFL